ncbi:hypothetical protein [Kitasatospora viridis]|uniref:Histidine phosphatase family protein n=1 Tax=Kitasatospora viridis TaxID=281105 RepID=A0A561UC84_9ACTN|nr:hypothetical protein [Kitasatospora viridis]TWF96977.1 hypothetical protein FHX73_11751 [Kitasatospora viridis]
MNQSRRRVLLGLAAAPLLLAGCGSTSKKKHGADAASAAAPGADVTVMIIRHGEKPADGAAGHDETGHPDKSSLTDRGWQRADALPHLFTPQPATGLRTPAKVYAATDTGPHAGAHRMRETVTPLAQQLGLTLDLTYAESQEAALAGAAAAQPGPVLICWEHTRIPAIVKALALAPDAGAPSAWPGDRFDLVWVFTRTAGVWSFQQVNQHLLPGDA